MFLLLFLSFYTVCLKLSFILSLCTSIMSKIYLCTFYTHRYVIFLHHLLKNALSSLHVLSIFTEAN